MLEGFLSRKTPAYLICCQFLILAFGQIYWMSNSGIAGKSEFPVVSILRQPKAFYLI